MYAKLVKLRYAWTSIALLIIIILISVWYRQPVDIYGLDSVLEVETIHVSRSKTERAWPTMIWKAALSLFKRETRGLTKLWPMSKLWNSSVPPEI